MKTKISTLRYARILPSVNLATLCTDEFSGITVANKEAFAGEKKWWKYEDHLDIHFNEGHSVPGDISRYYKGMCNPCAGACCKDLPTHNMRIYVAPAEIEKICNRLEIESPDFVEEYVSIQGVNFGVIKVDEEGDCNLLTKDGCKLNDIRPLWCKLWVCEKLQERVGGQPNEYRSSQISKE